MATVGDRMRRTAENVQTHEELLTERHRTLAPRSTLNGQARSPRSTFPAHFAHDAPVEHLTRVMAYMPSRIP